MARFQRDGLFMTMVKSINFTLSIDNNFIKSYDSYLVIIFD